MENSNKEKGRGKGREKECTTSRKVKLVSQHDIPKEQSTHLRTVQVVSDNNRFADANEEEITETKREVNKDKTQQAKNPCGTRTRKRTNKGKY